MNQVPEVAAIINGVTSNSAFILISAPFRIKSFAISTFPKTKKTQISSIPTHIRIKLLPFPATQNIGVKLNSPGTLTSAPFLIKSFAISKYPKSTKIERFLNKQTSNQNSSPNYLLKQPQILRYRQCGFLN